jgi:putative transposase
VTNEVVRRFGVIGIEDLNVAGMGHRKSRLGRSVADAALGELRRQITYKAGDRGFTVVVIDRFYPSSKTCSSCGSVKAKLDRAAAVFDCPECDLVIDRDVNAAINIAREAARLLGESDRPVAGLRPETRNADPRLRKTRGAHALTAAAA